MNQEQKCVPIQIIQVVINSDISSKKLLTKDELAIYMGKSTNSSWINGLMQKGVLMETRHYRRFGTTPMFIREAIEEDIIAGKI